MPQYMSEAQKTTQCSQISHSAFVWVLGPQVSRHLEQEPLPPESSWCLSGSQNDADENATAAAAAGDGGDGSCGDGNGT